MKTAAKHITRDIVNCVSSTILNKLGKHMEQEDSGLVMMRRKRAASHQPFTKPPIPFKKKLPEDTQP